MMDPDVDPIIPSRSPTKWISLPVKLDPGFTGGSKHHLGVEQRRAFYERFPGNRPPLIKPQNEMVVVTHHDPSKIPHSSETAKPFISTIPSTPTLVAI
jgi:hypothetical protein